MALCEGISLRELFNQYTDTGQAVCLKTIPVTASKDSLIFFIEAIFKSDVIAIYFPLPDAKDCCVAVMEESLLDMADYTRRLQEKTLEGNRVSAYPLGSPKGLIIRQVPKEASDQFLELYFESPKSCGEDGCVEEVRSCDCCQDRMVVIVIKDVKVVRRIIEKKSHPSLDKFHLYLEPYFPVFHDIMYARHCEAQSPKTSLQYARAQGLKPVLASEELCQRSEVNRSPSKESVNINAPEPLEVNSSAVMEATQNMKSNTSQTSSNLDQHQSSFQGTKPNLPSTTQSYYYQKPSTKLRIFTDDDDQLPASVGAGHDSQSGQTLDKHRTMQNAPFRYSEEEAKLLNEFKNIPDVASKGNASFNTGVQLKPIKAVKPFCNLDAAHVSPVDDTEERAVRPKLLSPQQRLHSDAKKYNESQVSHENQTNEQNNRHRKPKRSASDFNSDDTNTVTLPKTNIVLLKINGFIRKCGNCKVALIEKQGRVEFDGDLESIRQAKIKMYETLQNVEETTKVLPKHLVQYIDRSQGYLRAQLTKRKIGAALKIDVSQSTVKCLAFTTKQAERGLDIVTKELSSKQIKIREGQSQYFESSDWIDILKGLEKQVQVTVAKEDGVVDIVAYNEDSANMAYRKIIQYLKESIPKDKTEIELKGATARCFRRYFLHELQQTIRKQNGDIKWNSEGRENLKIEIEGDPSLFNLVNDKVKLVWHEKVDFKRITTNASELWLLMKGLASQRAKEFMDRFEKDHTCFIEMLKEGEVALPPVSIQRTTDESTDTHSSSLDRDNSYDAIPKRRQSHEISESFQSGLSDDEALQLALMQSMSEPLLHTHDEDQLWTLQKEEYDFPRSQTPGNLKRYGEPRGVIHEAEAYHTLKECTRTIGNITVTIKQGSIATDKISSHQRIAKINVVGPSRDIEKDSVISKSFVRAGGQELVRNYESAKDQFSSSVVVTQVTQGRTTLNCDYVFHVTLQKTSRPQSIISQVMQECFQHCTAYRCGSIALPPLGVGRLYKYQHSVVAENMIASIQSGAQTRNLQEIVIIIYDKDEEIYQVFEDQLNDTSNIPPSHFLGPFDLIRNPMQGRQVAGYRSIPQVGQLDQALTRPIPAPLAARRSSVPFDQPVSRPANQRFSRDSQTAKSAQFKPKLPSSENYYSSNRDSDDRTPLYSRNSREKQPQRSQFRRPKERSPPEDPVAKYKIKVFSRDKQACERARNELSRHLKSHFLFEVKLERRGKLSSDCKKRIRDVLKRRNVKSFPIQGTKNYAIKGEERSVTEANAEILKIILEFKDSEKPFESQRARRKELRAKPKEYVRHMALEHEGEVPSYWKNWKSGSLIREALTSIKTITKDFITVTLDETDPVYKAIINLIRKTWDGSKVGQGKDAKGLETLNYTNIRVTKIRRVENLQLFDKYVSRRKHIFIDTHKRQKSSCTAISNLPSSTGSTLTEDLRRCHVFEDELCSEVNEHFFFHGTTRDTVDVICDGGLDSRLGSHQAMYGAGIYGAESPTKADQYADPKDKRTKDGKKMILMRMVLGEGFLCTDQNPHKYRRPPCADMKCLRDDCKTKSHGSFDSVIGQSGRLFREFVVYQPEQCYPEYVISYDRV